MRCLGPQARSHAANAQPRIFGIAWNIARPPVLLQHSGRRRRSTPPLAAASSTGGDGGASPSAGPDRGGDQQQWQQQQEGPQISPQQLTSLIKRAGDWGQLDAALRRHGGPVNHIHASAAITRCAHLLEGGGGSSSSAGGSGGGLAAFLQHLVQLVADQVPRYEARQVANSLWALAVLAPLLPGLSSDEEDRRRRRRRRQQQQQQQLGHEGKEDAAAAGGGATGSDAMQSSQAAAQLAEALVARAATSWESFSAQELAVTLHSMTALGVPPGSCGLPAAAARVSAAAPMLKPQELVLLLGAANDLGLRFSEAAWGRMLARMAATAPAFEPRDAAGVLHGIAGAAARDPACHPGRTWLDVLLTATLPVLPSFAPRDLAVSLHALGRLRHQPPRPWMARVLYQCLKERGAMGSRELCMCLHGVGAMHARAPNRWCSGMVAEALAQWRQQEEDEEQEQRDPWQRRQQQQERQRERLMLLWALARMRFRPQVEQLAALVLDTAGSPDATGGPADPATPYADTLLLWALARLQYLPPRPLFAPLLARSFRRLPAAPLGEAATVLFSAAALLAPAASRGAAGTSVRAWLRAVAAVRPRFSEMPLQGLAMVAWGAAQLHSAAGASGSTAPGSGSSGDGSGSSGDEGSGGDGSGSAIGSGTLALQQVVADVWAAAAPRLDKANSRALAVLLWSCARSHLQLEPQQLLAALRRQAEQGTRTRPQAVALTLWAAAVLTHQQLGPDNKGQQQQQDEEEKGEQQQPGTTDKQQQPGNQQDHHHHHHQQQGSGSPTPLLWESEAFREALFDLLSASMPSLSSWGPQDLANTAWALSRLRLVPSNAWLGRFYSASGRRLPAFGAQELANLAWGLLRLRAGPPPGPWVGLLRAEADRRKAREDPEQPWRGRDRQSVNQVLAIWLTQINARQRDEEYGNDGGL